MFEKILDEYNTAEEEQVGSSKRLNLSQDIICNYLAKIVQEAPPVKDGDKYSPSKTLARLKTRDLQCFVNYVYLQKTRTKILTGSAAKNTIFCSLVPLLLASYKMYGDVTFYESWDKEDVYMKIFLGRKLWQEYNDYKGLVFTNQEIQEARKIALSQDDIAATTYPRKSVYIGMHLFTAHCLVRHMLLQTWVANVTLRNDNMILDINDWDNIPERLDEVPLVKEELPFPMPKLAHARIEVEKEDMPF